MSLSSAPEFPADRLQRPLRDLRVSVTDRCNFRCTYCMPREVFGAGYEFLHRRDLLTFEEISRLAALFASLGTRKIRLTGGEPLLRKNLDDLIRRLRHAAPETELTLTTNGSLLHRQADALRAAGLHRITVSLDALEESVFQQMNDAGFTARQVIEGIGAAESAGFSSIKINCVIRRGVNENAIPDLVRHFSGTGHVLRFIEYMDVGSTNGWRLDDVVPAREMAARVEALEGALTPLPPTHEGEVARRYQTPGGGEIGIIASVTRPFCRSCNRARLSSDGRLFTCLFGTSGHDLRAPLRDGASDAELHKIIAGIWTRRDDQYSENRAAGLPRSGKVEMSAIGG